MLDTIRSRLVQFVIVFALLNTGLSAWRLHIYLGDDWLDGHVVHRPAQSEYIGQWAMENKGRNPIIGVLPDGKRVKFPNADPFHTIEAALRCNQYVYQAMQRAGGPQWCVRYGCRCLVAPGSLIGNADYNPKNGVLLDVY